MRTEEKNEKTLFTMSLQRNEAHHDAFKLPQVSILGVYIKTVAFVGENGNS